MGYDILESEGKAVFICNTSDTAFGPIMEGREQAQRFVGWLNEDPRHYTDAVLIALFEDFQKEGGSE